MIRFFFHCGWRSISLKVDLQILPGRTWWHMRETEQRISGNANDEADICQLVNQVLAKLHPEIEKRKVCVEIDVAELTARVDYKSIESAIENLLKHALTTMSGGGELSVTLIDGNFQWELEVADSSYSNQFWEQVDSQSKRTLPQAVPYIIDQFLVEAHRMAMKQGGEIQTWDCPQGGMANVLVVPKRGCRPEAFSRPAA